MELFRVAIEKPDSVNLIFGQTHFIKTVEDLHEALVGTVPGIEFGLAFCEASGPALVRTSGTSPEMVDLAAKNALAIGAGHSFLIFLKNAFPINVLNAVKAVPEVCRIFCASANPVEVILVESGEGRAVLGVVDGCSPKGVEREEDVAARMAMLRKFGYKFGGYRD
ncbi:MAG: adenosine-specific kinase [Anaerolineales bacterium]